MRYVFLSVLLLMPLPVWAQNELSPAAVIHDKGLLVRDIILEGFQLENRNQFIKLFKPYRNKYMKKEDMDMVLQKIKDIYEKEGYQQLVSISYQVIKHRLVFTVLMTS